MTPHLTSDEIRAAPPANGQHAASGRDLGRLARRAGWVGLGLGLTYLALSRKTTGGSDETRAVTVAREVHAKSAITINAPVEEVFPLWEGFQGVPRFMRDVAAVEAIDERRSRWSLSGPGGMTAAWDVEISETRPNELIAWQTAAGSRLTARGEVRFRPAPGDRGTEVVFDAVFSPPGGEAGRKIAALVAEVLGTKLGNDLRRSKQLIELGEIVQSDDSVIPGPNPAQPAARHAA